MLGWEDGEGGTESETNGKHARPSSRPVLTDGLPPRLERAPRPEDRYGICTTMAVDA